MEFSDMTLNELEELANFYLVDTYDMIKGDEIVFPETPIHGLKHTEVTSEDFKSISEFGKIVKNYQKLKRLSEYK
jgi:hypothetical protein